MVGDELLLLLTKIGALGTTTTGGDGFEATKTGVMVGIMEGRTVGIESTVRVQFDTGFCSQKSSVVMATLGMIIIGTSLDVVDDDRLEMMMDSLHEYRSPGKL